MDRARPSPVWHVSVTVQTAECYGFSAPSTFPRVQDARSYSPTARLYPPPVLYPPYLYSHVPKPRRRLNITKPYIMSFGAGVAGLKTMARLTLERRGCKRL